MNTIQDLAALLAGDYGGLYGEVVTEDTYRLRQLKFKPDVVFDIGANIGIFSRFARELWPDAWIFAVEPHPDNCAAFRAHTSKRRMHLRQAALGKGPVYHGLTARNGSGETYLSAGLGYPLAQMQTAMSVEESLVDTVTLPQLLSTIAYSDRFASAKYLMKIDCEGAENTLWEDPQSMSILRQMDYLCMELHFYALTEAEKPKVYEVTWAALNSLKETHVWEYNGVHFWATKKETA